MGVYFVGEGVNHSAFGNDCVQMVLLVADVPKWYFHARRHGFHSDMRYVLRGDVYLLVCGHMGPAGHGDFLAGNGAV